jgi:F-type H+-transporting ATPase subunit gamma
MQMVAAAKLRRAQEAAEAARPYAERMDAVLANIAQAVAGRRRAGAAGGTGKDEVHLLSSAPPSAALRRLQLLDRASRPRAAPRCSRRQDGQDHLRRPQGLRHPAPRLREADRRAIDLREVRSSATSTPRRSREKVIAMFEAGEFDVCTLFYSRFKSVIAQIPTAQQIIPAAIPKRRRRGRHGAPTNTSRSEEILADLLPRNISTQIFRALLENAASSRARR